MSRFTTSERRGTIAVLLIMAAIVIYLGVSVGMHRSVPQPMADTIRVMNDEGAKPGSERRKKPAKAKRDSTTTRKKGRTASKSRKAGSGTESARSRSVLDETVSEP